MTALQLQRILRLPDVESFSGKKKSQIYDDIDRGLFPAPIPLGPRAVGWLESELLAWQQARLQEPRGTRNDISARRRRTKAGGGRSK